MKRIANVAVVFAGFTLFAAIAAAAQASAAPSDSSLADYARKVRKEPSGKAKPKVFDNDNLPKDDKLSIVGEAPAQDAADTTAADASQKTNAPADDPAAGDKSASAPKTQTASATESKPEDDQAKKQQEWKTWQDKLKAQKDANDLASRELDVLQKEYQLRAAAIYADVGNRLRNQASWDKEDADFKQKIADKQKAVDDGKQKLEDLDEQARRAGVPAGMREP